jgi:uncharacterized protein
MRNYGFIGVLLLVIVAIDIYVFQIVKWLSQSANQKTRTIVYASYWGISILAVLLLLLLPYLQYQNWPKLLRTYLFAMMIGLFLAKVLAVVFFLIDDLRRLVQWVIVQLSSATSKNNTDEATAITRSVFLTWLGVAAGTTLFGTLLLGFKNKYNYQLKRVSLSFKNLPEAFKGLKIVHISDIHSGSFTDKTAVLKGIEKILNEKPDLIFFTGDLVNDRATEMDDYTDVFSLLKAPLGVYSTLGNHDYGDYVQWESDAIKKANLETLKNVHKTLGWKLLMNEHVAIEKNGCQMAVLGIENWSAKGRFPKYGKMEEAYEGAQQYPFKILLSHDPSHWDAEVKTKYRDVDLMLAGHTHGMQFGLQLAGFQWSPVQYMYKQWAGLYQAGKQKLYVNRGFGFIGYPGRVGILPEITVIELTT